MSENVKDQKTLFFFPSKLSSLTIVSTKSIHQNSIPKPRKLIHRNIRRINPRSIDLDLMRWDRIRAHGRHTTTRIAQQECAASTAPNSATSSSLRLRRRTPPPPPPSRLSSSPSSASSSAPSSSSATTPSSPGTAPDPDQATPNILRRVISGNLRRRAGWRRRRSDRSR